MHVYTYTCAYLSMEQRLGVFRKWMESPGTPGAILLARYLRSICADRGEVRVLKGKGGHAEGHQVCRDASVSTRCDEKGQGNSQGQRPPPSRIEGNAYSADRIHSFREFRLGRRFSKAENRGRVHVPNRNWCIADKREPYVRGSNLPGKFGKGLLFSEGVAICQYPHYRKERHTHLPLPLGCHLAATYLPLAD